MAYYLEFDGYDDHVNLPAWSDTFSSYISLEVSFSPDVSVPAGYEKIFGVGNYSFPQFSQTVGFFSLEALGGGAGWNFVFTDATDNRRISNSFSASDPNKVYTFRAYYNDPLSTLDLYISEDGGGETLIQSYTNISRNVFASKPGLHIGESANGGPNFKGSLYAFKIDVDGTSVRTYDPSASGGTGSVLPDTTSLQDGTLVYFPADDSEWVFYSDGLTTPINLSITNLLSTSARLNWEQG